MPCVSAASLAIKESKEQWDNGNLSESDPEAEPLIQKYFGWTSRNSSRPSNVDRWGTGRRRVGKHKGRKQLNPVKERNKDGVAVDWRHWSAAYVSWVMGQFDGEGAKWYVLEGHSGYIRSFKNKRAEIEKNPEDHIGKMYYLWFTKGRRLPGQRFVTGRTPYAVQRASTKRRTNSDRPRFARNSQCPECFGSGGDL